jgi:hypothetical protein
VVLGQTELLEGSTSGDLNLSSDNVDTSDLLSDGVLDLDTRVDPAYFLAEFDKSRNEHSLNEVVSVLLVDQELGSTGVAVLDGLGEPDRIS